MLALVFLFLGAGFGLVFSYNQPSMMEGVEDRLDRSLINRTYSAAEEAVTRIADDPANDPGEMEPDIAQPPGFRAPGLALLLLFGNNLLVASGLTFGSRMFTPAYAAAMTSYILFLNGAMTTSLFFKTMVGVSLPFAVATMMPHGAVEALGVVLAGALGYTSLTDGRVRIPRWFAITVVPLIALGSAIEVVVTPLFVA
jgi:uncharacterized membrane protein SpoIIM required for sporulation